MGDFNWILVLPVVCLAAYALLTMILSGITLAILRKPKKKILLTMGLLVLGCVLLAVLAANR